ncbi:MAG TPA: hypothetical protein VIM41_09095 [Gammaproteobacteria bacterium]
MMDKMMDFMVGRMSQEEKQLMMDRMMDRFFADMTADDKSKMMAQMMPKMMEGVNVMEMMPQMMVNMMGGEESEGGMMGMMSRMKGDNQKKGMPMMPQMMMEMMPKCLKMMLSNISKEKRIDFVSKMVATFVEQGSVGMSEEEKKSFHETLAEKMES